jgi:imidazole glycerol-phosphate synthase subunit HisF
MLRKRVIVCLDLKHGRVVEDVRFEGSRDVGDPVELAEYYANEGADEIVLLDVAASAEGRRALFDIVRRTAERLFVPLTVGGGFHEVADIGLALRAGADKVSINSAAVQKPELIREASQRFGSTCIIASIDARLERRQIEIAARPDGAQIGPIDESAPGWFRVFTHAGQTATELDAITWARQCAHLGAGEILITSIDQDGARAGYDLELTARIVEAVSVPVIASGGAGSAEHMRDVFLLAGAQAALAAGIFHSGAASVGAVKRMLAAAGIEVRLDATPSDGTELDSPLPR